MSKRVFEEDNGSTSKNDRYSRIFFSRSLISFIPGKYKYFAQDENSSRISKENSNGTNEMLLLILGKLNRMEDNHKEMMEAMMEKYMTKLTFLESELLKLQILVRKSLKDRNNELTIAQIQHAPGKSENQNIQIVEDPVLFEFTDKDNEAGPSQEEKIEPSAESEQFEEVQIDYEEFQEYEIQEEKLKKSPKDEKVIFMIKKRKSAVNKKKTDLQCMNMIPVNTESDLLFLDKLLETNETERSGFVDFLRKAKFSNNLKQAFTEIISEVLLLDYNYSGKGQTKKALNEYLIFSNLIYGRM